MIAAPPRHVLPRLRNLAHSAVLVLGMALIVAGCAWTLWGWEGVLWAVGAVGLAMVLTPSIPTAFVLSLYRARPMSRADFPEGYAVLDELARRAGLAAVPRLFYVPSAVANAFAVGGRRDAAVAVSDGMLRVLSLRELAAVLAHEISHVANNDLWIMTLADTMSRVTVAFSYAGLFLLLVNLPLVLLGEVAVPWALILLLMLAPTLMSLLQLALSRAREYDADLEAARLAGDPAGLASALLKLERRQGGLWESILLPGRRVPEPSLLRTHPTTAERVRRLVALEEREPGQAAAVARDGRPVVPSGYRVVAVPPRWRWPGIWY